MRNIFLLLCSATAFSAVVATSLSRIDSYTFGKGESDLKPHSVKVDELSPGGLASTACRYDDAEWSDCDPIELIRYRVLRLLHGGRQCEEVRNITKHCTPEEYAPGTKWLIAEHRRCVAELRRLKAMITDLAKYVSGLHDKGRSLLNAYLELQTHLEELRNLIESLKWSNDQKRGVLTALQAQIEEWKMKAQTLHEELDEMKTKYRGLQIEHKELGEKLKEGRADRLRCLSENERLRQKKKELEAENSELKRRFLEAERYKERLTEAKYAIGKFEYKVEKLNDQAERIKDELEQCKLHLMTANNYEDEQYSKDTHVDLEMDMWITHNKTRVSPSYSTLHYTRPTKPPPVLQPLAQCLITYYGLTNDTCWYRTKIQLGKAPAAGALGHHVVEAHRKYFTVGVRDGYECDLAAQLHYEFLVKRCKSSRPLPVISVFKATATAKILSTHVYPKPNIPHPGQANRCWVTFLGAHGQCEAHALQYPMYNSDDTPEGYMKGAGTSKSICLSRRDNWRTFCKTPVLITYLPEGVSTSWADEDIQHDSDGGKMFEELHQTRRLVNPKNFNPRKIARPQRKEEEEHEDAPEYRKPLIMKSGEREILLAQLRRRLHIDQPLKSPDPGSSQNVTRLEAKVETVAPTQKDENEKHRENLEKVKRAEVVARQAQGALKRGGTKNVSPGRNPKENGDEKDRPPDGKGAYYYTPPKAQLSQTSHER